MIDLVVRGGRVVDGTGAAAVTADVAIHEGVIVEVAPRIDAAAAEIIDAAGCIVTPGFVDVHTHYDGQVTWDEVLEPSTPHGVTTVVMGNCGVGFAPVHPGQENWLIELMEGVEDIPGAALHEGMSWGWETFPEYLDQLSRRQWSIDVAVQIPHGPVRGVRHGPARSHVAAGHRGRSRGDEPDGPGSRRSRRPRFHDVPHARAREPRRRRRSLAPSPTTTSCSRWPRRSAPAAAGSSRSRAPASRPTTIPRSPPRKWTGSARWRRRPG